MADVLADRRAPRATVQPSVGGDRDDDLDAPRAHDDAIAAQLDTMATGQRPGNVVTHRRGVRRVLWLVAALSSLVALAASAFPTLSDWYAGSRQHQLAGQLDDPTLAGQVRAGTVGSGKPIARISIPAIGLDAVVVQGTSAGDLAEGPGHYASTPLLCTAGNAAIAGHRTTFLHPFYSLDALRPGDVITVTTPAYACRYAVSALPFAVAPTDVAVIGPTSGTMLTLTTCTPLGSAAQRLVVHAVLEPTSLRPAPASAHT